MNRTFKIFLGLAAVILVFCLILTVAGLFLFRSAGKALSETFQTEAATTAEIASQIADYELPAGYGNEVTAQLAGYSLIGYTGADAHSHIYLVQADSSTGLTMEEIQRHIRQTSDAEEDQMVDVKIVDTVQATIRGQEVNVVISEGPNHDGDVFRQVSGLFEGRGGPAVVIVSGLAATWNQALVDEFIASIR